MPVAGRAALAGVHGCLPISEVEPWQRFGEKAGFGCPCQIENVSADACLATIRRALRAPGESPVRYAPPRWGFELRIIGENAVAARYLGINVGRNIVLALLLSGALSGLAGACEVTGNLHRLSQGLPFDLGYTAIIVAWMAQLNPAGVLMVAVLMAGLLVGGDQLQTRMGLPAAISLVLQGMILFPMLAGNLFAEYRLRLVRHGRPAAAPAPEVPS